MNNALNYQIEIDKLVSLNRPIKRSFGHGLYLKISNSKKASWLFRYSINKKRKEIIIGEAVTSNDSYLKDCGRLSYKDALIKALEYERDLRKHGEDPSFQIIKTKLRVETLNEVAKDYFDNECDHFKHPDIARRLYDNYIKDIFGHLLIHDITTPMILNLLRTIKHAKKPTISNDVLQLLKSKIFPHVAIVGLTPHNPAVVLSNRNAGGKELARRRCLDKSEIDIVLKTMREHPTHFSYPNYLAIVLLLIFGCRKMELLSARWADINLHKQEWLVHVSKQSKGEEYTVINPIPDAVISIFEILKILSNGSEFVFPNRKAGTKNGYVCENTLNSALNHMFGSKKTKMRKSQPDLLGSVNIKHFVVHDLRRTCKTLMTSNGVSQFDSERCINHKQRGIESIYDRYDYFKERKAAFETVANIVMPFADIKKLDF